MKDHLTKLVLTFDTDWAPEFVLEDVAMLLQGTPATFFVTDNLASDLLRTLENVELGIHPNFMPGSSHGRNRREVMDTLVDMVPAPRVVRSHNLLQDSTILDLYVEYNIQYDLSLLEYQNPSLQPFRYWNGLIRVPYNFEDDIACLRGDGFDIPAWMRSASVVICDFHPIHVYLNTEIIQRYASLRDRGSLLAMNRHDIEPFVNRDMPGVRSLLISLLHEIAQGTMLPFTVLGHMGSLPVADWATPNSGDLSTQHAPFRTII